MRVIPPALLRSLDQLKGFDESAFLAAHQEDKAITSVRLNPFKEAALDLEFAEAVPWCNGAFYLKNRPSFTHDPLFHAGCYYVQEAGSMFIELALKQCLNFKEPLTVLDACAAPGGKSTLINSLLSEESLLVANEFVKSRADVLAYNLSKWGTRNSIVTNNDTAKFTELDSWFDAIVIDAPCSGSGLFRKQPEAIDEWSENHVIACAQRQQKILSDLLPALKENGILIYSTCSYSVQENEDVVNWLIRDFDMDLVPLPLPANAGIIASDNGYRFYPHLAASEGFFCAVLRKTGPAKTAQRFKGKKNNAISRNEENILSQFIKPGLSCFKENNRLHAGNQKLLLFFETFEKHFYFKKAGVLMGEIKGKDLVPDHELALSVELEKNIQTLELEKEQALDYLRKNVFSVSGSKPGLTLMCYKGQGIGWAKVLPNRMNNYLPNELRVLR